ncbi:uncharacterized protein LOC125233467 [Leguminivora glycinivorella]|uniref:uncharacterized protein LOC125233467 n=1 Tax=Leguminivora glycinivorella TaxID=1035111 RepID=UPI00200E342B|nr:uncharacterized protein LOC125233467 [Leguminivora glycinivorella]
MAISRLSILKFLELALTVSCVGIHAVSFNGDVETGMLVTGTFVGYLIVIAGAACGYVLQTPSHKRVDIFYTLIGVGLFIASGAILIDRFHNASRSEFVNKNLAKASLSIINGAVLLVDAILTQRGG